MKLTPIAACTALLLCSSPPSFAQTERELDAHEHGVATLDVALDGTRLYLDLATPAYNVLGFEHAPSTDEQRQTVSNARALLESDVPFVPDPAAGCTLEEASVTIELAEEDAHGDEGHGEEGHSDEEAHGHDEHADEEHSDEEAHGHDEHGDEEHAGEEHSDDEAHGHEEHADGAVHSDIETSHVFACERSQYLGRVTTTLFDAFPGFTEIDVQVAGPGGQTALELSPGRTVVDLEPVR